MKVSEITEGIKQLLDPKCWKGKHKEGTKIKGGIRVNNCVPNESVEEGWKDAAAAAAMVGALGTGAYQGAKHSAPTTNIDGKEFIMYRHTPGDYEKNKMKLTTDDAGNKVYAWVTTSGMKPQYTYRYYIPAKEGVKEAANAAQQAAIAISMKKAGKKPKKDVKEASGHIPTNDTEAHDPRWSNALTVDISPGEDKKQAAKFGFKISNSGPPKLKTNGKA